MSRSTIGALSSKLSFRCHRDRKGLDSRVLCSTGLFFLASAVVVKTIYEHKIVICIIVRTFSNILKVYITGPVYISYNEIASVND